MPLFGGRRHPLVKTLPAIESQHPAIPAYQGVEVVAVAVAGTLIKEVLSIFESQGVSIDTTTRMSQLMMQVQTLALHIIGRCAVAYGGDEFRRRLLDHIQPRALAILVDSLTEGGTAPDEATAQSHPSGLHSNMMADVNDLDAFLSEFENLGIDLEIDVLDTVLTNFFSGIAGANGVENSRELERRFSTAVTNAVHSANLINEVAAAAR